MRKGDQVEGKIRELRAHYGKPLYRVLITVTRTKKTPKKELRIARLRMRNDQWKRR